MGVHRELAGHVQLLFDGIPVQDVGLVLATIKNSGNQAIRKEDRGTAQSFALRNSQNHFGRGDSHEPGGSAGASLPGHQKGYVWEEPGNGLRASSRVRSDSALVEQRKLDDDQVVDFRLRGERIAGARANSRRFRNSRVRPAPAKDEAHGRAFLEYVWGISADYVQPPRPPLVNFGWCNPLHVAIFFLAIHHRNCGFLCGSKVEIETEWSFEVRRISDRGTEP